MKSLFVIESNENFSKKSYGYVMKGRVMQKCLVLVYIFSFVCLLSDVYAAQPKVGKAGKAEHAPEEVIDVSGALLRPPSPSRFIGGSSPSSSSSSSSFSYQNESSSISSPIVCYQAFLGDAEGELAEMECFFNVFRKTFRQNVDLETEGVGVLEGEAGSDFKMADVLDAVASSLTSWKKNHAVFVASSDYPLENLKEMLRKVIEPLFKEGTEKEKMLKKVASLDLASANFLINVIFLNTVLLEKIASFLKEIQKLYSQSTEGQDTVAEAMKAYKTLKGQLIPFMEQLPSMLEFYNKYLIEEAINYARSTVALMQGPLNISDFELGSTMGSVRQVCSHVLSQNLHYTRLPRLLAAAKNLCRKYENMLGVS